MRAAKPDIRAVIMAGGSGTRFWPLSRRKRPKQFLPIISDKTMIEETALRLSPLVPHCKIYTIASGPQTRMIRRLLPKVPPDNLLVEPLGKNTAPSLILATAWIYLKNPKAVVAVLPSDHLISDPAAFRKKLESAAAAASGEEALITFGIPPTFPSTGYGYIHFKRDISHRFLGDMFFEVSEFKEKPTLETAVEFLKQGDYAWNSGMFLWRAEVFAGKLERFAPELYPFWVGMLGALRSGSTRKIAAIFKDIPALSIDYGLMEKAGGILVGEGNFGWSDVGAWSSLADIWMKDAAGNAVKGEAVVLDSQNTLCFNPGKLTALIGVKDLVIVNTPDALLVCRLDKDQSVKTVIEVLSKKGRHDLL